MLSTMQPQGSIARTGPSLPPFTTIHYDSTKHFYSYLTFPTVDVCLKAEFVEDIDIAPMQPNPIDTHTTKPTPFGRPPRTFSENQIDSPGLRTFQRANVELRNELKYCSAGWDDEDELGMNSNSTQPLHRSKTQRTPVGVTTSPKDEVDIFELQNQPGSAPDSQQPDEDQFANQLGSLDLSSTNNTSPNTHLSPQDPPLPHSTDTQAVNIINNKRLKSPLQAPQRDPRQLFGSEGTHLPWVRKLSPNRFAMNISPEMLPHGSPLPKSVWEAEDDEFDRWPTPMQARDELETVRRNATLKRNTFVKPETVTLTVAEQIAEAVETPLGYTNRTTDEEEQLILELSDMSCGNPWGRDAHDNIIKLFFSRAYNLLPIQAPARHMHVLDAQAYTSSTDPVIKVARPRLCDAVATVLAYTSPECLEAFLNSEVEVFEWRRLGNCVMIRRERNEVWIGNYYNFGTTYQWGYLVRSTIDTDGAWSETWASMSQGTTPVTKDSVLFEKFEVEGSEGDVEPDDEEFALYVGRELADFLLRWSVWDYHKWWRYKVEWEADGRVTNAREKNRFPAGLTLD